MSHFSPIPPGERVYAPNYREELQHLEAQLVQVSGRVKEFREHPEREDLESLLLVNLIIAPLPKGKSIKLSHLWVLTKHVRRAGVEPTRGRRVTFIGSVYAYFRLGGKSKQRGLHGSHDFSILPMGPAEIESFTPGIKQRYEIEVNPDTGADRPGQGGSDLLVQGTPCGSEHAGRRHGDNGHPQQGSDRGDLPDLDHQHGREARPKHASQPKRKDGGRGFRQTRDHQRDGR